MPEEKFPAPPKSLTFGQPSAPGKEEKQPPKLGIVLRNLTMGEKGALKPGFPATPNENAGLASKNQAAIEL